MRMLEERDIPALVKLSRRKSEQMGYAPWLPPLADENTVAFVVEREGRVEGAMVFRKVHDMMLVGDSPEFIRTLFGEEAKIRAVLEARGVSEVVSAVPRSLLGTERKRGAIARFLQRLRFRNISESFVCFEGEV